MHADNFQLAIFNMLSSSQRPVRRKRKPWRLLDSDGEENGDDQAMRQLQISDDERNDSDDHELMEEVLGSTEENVTDTLVTEICDRIFAQNTNTRRWLLSDQLSSNLTMFKIFFFKNAWKVRQLIRRATRKEKLMKNVMLMHLLAKLWGRHQLKAKRTLAITNFRRWWRRIYHHLLDLAVCNGAIIWKNVPSGSQVHKPHRSFILSLVDGLLVEADGMDLVCDREERQQANEQEKEGKRKRNRSQPRHVKRLRGANCNNHYPVLECIPAVAGQDHRPWCSVTGCKYKTRDRCIVCKLPFCNSSSRQCFRVHLIEQDRKDLSKEEIITSVHAPLFNSDILPHTSS